MFFIPGSMSPNSASQLCTERSRFNAEDLLPLKVCLRFNPSSIALYYKLVQSPNVKFLHQIDIEKEIESNMPAEDIYNRLVEHEPMYWSPRSVSKDQIMRLIEKLIEKNSRVHPWTLPEETHEPGATTDQSHINKVISISSSACCAPELVMNANELVGCNAESVVVAQPLGESELDLNKENGVGGKFIPEVNASSICIEEDKADSNTEFVDEVDPKNDSLQKKASEKLGGLKNDTRDYSYNKFVEDQEKNYSTNETANNIKTNPDEIELLEVYMSELNQKAYMDKDGNLYDTNGNCLGQAEIEEN
eukprot:TRINITY_DN7143_c0_g6_i2.p1 TRINITY_DN7143_c0_g6~~TRINITY_DN7143_c0_g6_i2.p1  ORF type:complete len:305 (-),score=69.50 TRINITY_DN7143_c0_g6_i2:933-1847(-)